MIEVPISELKDGDHYLLELRNFGIEGFLAPVPNLKAKVIFRKSLGSFEIKQLKGYDIGVGWRNRTWNNLQWGYRDVRDSSIHKIYYDTALNKDHRHEEKVRDKTNELLFNQDRSDVEDALNEYHLRPLELPEMEDLAWKYDDSKKHQRLREIREWYRDKVKDLGDEYALSERSKTTLRKPRYLRRKAVARATKWFKEASEALSESPTRKKSRRS